MMEGEVKRRAYIDEQSVEKQEYTGVEYIDASGGIQIGDSERRQVEKDLIEQNRKFIGWGRESNT